MKAPLRAALPALLLSVSAALLCASCSCSRRTPAPAPEAAAENPAAAAMAAARAEAARAAAEEAERARAAAEAARREEEARARVERTRGPADPAAALALRTPPPKGAKARTVGRNPWRGAIAVDVDSGRILFDDAADTPCLPASMTKMMLLLVVQERIEAGAVRTNDVVAVSERAFKTGGSQVYLDPRESFPLEDMLYAVMVQSANDAAVAVAEHVAGSCEAMVSLMNRRASELGMRDTSFSSVHGLPAAPGALDDVSTPRDMAILSRELCKHPGAMRYAGESYRVFRPEPRLFEMRTHNPALQPGSRIPGADGLKTGYTRRAGYSLSVSAERGGRRVVAVMMGTAVENAKGELDPASSKRLRNAKISELVERAFSALAEP